MRRLTFFASTLAIAMLTLMLAVPAEAQHRGHGGGGGGRPSGAGAPAHPGGGHGGGAYRPSYRYRTYYRPYYRPYYPYYRPYYPSWGLGVGLWGWGYPWGVYGVYGYPWYGFGGYGGWYGYPYDYAYYGYPYYYRADNTGSLRTEVKPRETQVYVDGYLAGVADDFDGTFQRLHVRPGEHHILFHLSGFKNVSQTIYVQAGNTYKLKYQMEPLPQGAPPEPIPQPEPGAAAREQQDERPPNAVEARPEPPREPYPPREAYPPRESNPPREPSPSQPGGERRSESRFGAVAIRVQPPDAAILIDGQPWRGPADEDGAVVIQLSSGTHRIEIGRDGFERYETEINVRPGTTTPVNVMLQRR